MYPIKNKIANYVKSNTLHPHPHVSDSNFIFFFTKYIFLYLTRSLPISHVGMTAFTYVGIT